MRKETKSDNKNNKESKGDNSPEMASTAVINGGTTMLRLVELRASFRKRLRTDKYRPSPTKQTNGTTHYDIDAKDTENSTQISKLDNSETKFKEDNLQTEQTNGLIVRTEQTSSYVYENATFEADIIKDDNDNAMCDAEIIQDKVYIESNSENEPNVTTLNWLNNSEEYEATSSYGYDNATFEVEIINEDNATCDKNIIESKEYIESDQENESNVKIVRLLNNSEDGEERSDYLYDESMFEAEIIKDDSAMCDANILQETEYIKSNQCYQEKKSLNWLNNSEEDDSDNSTYEAEIIKDDSSICEDEIIKDKKYFQSNQCIQEKTTVKNVTWLNNSEIDKETSSYSYNNATYETVIIKNNIAIFEDVIMKDKEYYASKQRNQENDSFVKIVHWLKNPEEAEETSSYGYDNATYEAEIIDDTEHMNNVILKNPEEAEETSSYGYDNATYEAEIIDDTEHMTNIILKNPEEAEETSCYGYDNATYEAEIIDDTEHMNNVQRSQIDSDFAENTVHKPYSASEGRNTSSFGYYNESFEADIKDNKKQMKKLQNNQQENGFFISDAEQAENLEDTYTDDDKISVDFYSSAEKSLGHTDDESDVESIDHKNYKKYVQFNETENGFDNNNVQRFSGESSEIESSEVESSEVESIEEHEHTEYTVYKVRRPTLAHSMSYAPQTDKDKVSGRDVKLTRVQSSHSYFADSSSSESDEDSKIRNAYHKNRRNSFMLQADYLEKRLSQKDKNKQANSSVFVIQEEPETTSGGFKYSELNYYMQLIKHKGKVEHAAFIDFEGQLLIQDEAMGLEENTASSLVQVINCTPRTNLSKTPLFRIKIASRDFLCFKNNEFSLVGLGANHFVHASTSKYFVVLVLSDPESQGSCICQVAQFLRHVDKHAH